MPIAVSSVVIIISLDITCLSTIEPSREWLFNECLVVETDDPSILILGFDWERARSTLDINYVLGFVLSRLISTERFRSNSFSFVPRPFLK